MAALQGHVTNSRGNKQSAIAHKKMEAMVRTWTGGITVHVYADDTFRVYGGPHDSPSRHLLLEGMVGDPPTLTEETDAPT